MSPGLHSVPFLHFTQLDYTSPHPYIGPTTTMKLSAMSPIPLAKRLSFRRGMKLLRPHHPRNPIPEAMKVVSRLPGPDERERVRHILFPAGEYTDITDEEIASVIPSCVDLEVVQLSGIEETSDRTIIILAATATKLRGLDLGGCSRITNEGVLELAAKCTTLEWIRLSGVPGVTDSAISALVKSCPRLSELELDSCQGLTAMSIRDIWTFTRRLRRLKLTRCKQLTANAFPAFVDENTSVPYWQPSPVDEKESLTGSSALFPPLILPPAYSPDNLRVLDLGYCTKITDGAMAGIISNATKIQTLTISGCALLTDKTLDSICTLGENLEVLTMAHVSKITDTGVLRLVRACTRLRSVDVNCEFSITILSTSEDPHGVSLFTVCSNLGDLAVLELATLPSLRRLSLVQLDKLTDNAVFFLAEHTPTLERLHLSHCNGLSLDSIHHAIKKLSELVHLSATGVTALSRPGVERFSERPSQVGNGLPPIPWQHRGTTDT